MSNLEERLDAEAGRHEGDVRDLLWEAEAEIKRLKAEVARLVKSRNKWGQKYNQTLEKLKLVVWSDSEYVKAVDEAAKKAIEERDTLRAAIAYATSNWCDDPLIFLSEWNEGEPDTVAELERWRKEHFEKESDRDV